MALFPIRRVRTRQPPKEMAVDWSNPITRGLYYINGALATSPPSMRFPKDAVTHLGPAAKDNLNEYFEASDHKSDAEGTLLIIPFWESISYGFALLRLYSAWSTGLGNNLGIIWHESFTGSVQFVFTSQNVNYLNVLTSNVVNGDVLCLTGGPGGLNAYQNGRLIGSNATTRWTSDFSADTYLFIGECGENLGVAGRYPKKRALSLVFSRQLSPQEVASISANPWQIFAPETQRVFFSAVTAQYARPTSDVSAGTWTASSGSDLFDMLDETAANDTDYIVTTGASTCEVALGALSDPASSSGHIVRYRIAADSGGITVRLRQGTTTIATWTHASAPTSLTTYEQTLAGGEANSITDYSALALQFEAT